MPRLTPSGWPLRARLVAALIALLAVVCLAVGVVTTAALQRLLVEQVDGRLLAAGDRSAGAFEGPPREAHTDGPNGGMRGGPGFLELPRQAVGTIGARVVEGDVREAWLLDDTGSQRLGSQDAAPLGSVEVGDDPSTVSLGDLGDYRVVAQATRGGDVLVVGLPLADVQATVYRQAAVAAGIAAVALLVTGVAGAAIVRGTLRPLERVAATARRVTELPLDREGVPPAVRVPDEDTDPRTEVGQVGAALNTMLSHVDAALTARHASETRVRQFVADASHELRTPLATIRGYAELTRRHHGELPPTVAHAIGRVESEAERMTALVDDLLLLARLDSGRPLDCQPVDLSALLVDATADARVAGPEHRWLLALPAEPITVIGDRARLHQVVANLLTNARTHTPPGTTIAVRLHTDDGQALLSVSDDGPGIDATLLPAVFERFARGDGARSHAEGSTGLGLSIVAAVVQSHGGIVSVTSQPKRTEFVVALPSTRGGDHASHGWDTARGSAAGSPAGRAAQT